MKRKIFTFVAALAITAGSILPVAAAERNCGVHAHKCSKPAWFCQLQTGSCPDAGQKPSVPNVPEQEETPDFTLDAMTQLEKAACELINEIREENGLEPYAISEALSSKARLKAKDMKDNHYFSHTSPTYGSPFSMMQHFGITYRSAGENIAMGYRTAAAVVNAWMASASHRANILSTRYDTMGIGHTDGYWAQWFIR